MKDGYFVISCDEDGFNICFTRDVNRYLKEVLEDSVDGVTFLDDFPEGGLDRDNWLATGDCKDQPKEIILIKGCVVVPKKKQVVTVLEIP